MKALSKKSLILVLSLVFALTAFMFAFVVKPVSAETATGVFEVEELAQVRTGKNDTQGEGLRFRVKMSSDVAERILESENVDNVKLGFLITPKQLFDNAVTAATTAGTEFAAIQWITVLSNYVGVQGTGIVADEENVGFYEDGGYYYANAAVVGIKEANRALPFTMVAYIKTGDSYEYAVPSTDFSRDVHYTVNEAYWAGKTDKALIDAKFTWLGDAEYPYEISDVNEYKAFATSVSEEKTYENKAVEIVESIDLGSGDGSNVPVISGWLKGTITLKDDLRMAYKSTAGYVPLIETVDRYKTTVSTSASATADKYMGNFNYNIFKGKYDCEFTQDFDLMDDVIVLDRLSGGTYSGGNPNLGDATNYSAEEMASILAGGETAYAAIGTKPNPKYNNYNNFVAIDLGYSLAEFWKIPEATLTFKVAYTATTYSGNAIGAQDTASGGYSLITEAVACTEEGAGKWMEYSFPIADVIELQNNQAAMMLKKPSSEARYEGAPGYIRLLHSSPTKSYGVNIYVADVKIVKPTQLATIDANTYKVYDANDGIDVANFGDLPATVDANGYTGKVVYRATYSNFKFDLNTDLRNYDLTGYTHLAVWAGVPAVEYTEGATDPYYRFANTDTVFGKNMFFVPVGLETSETKLESGKMHKILIPITDVMNSLNENGEVRIFRLYRNGLVTSAMPIYFGQPEFVYSPENVTSGLSKTGGNTASYGTSAVADLTTITNGQLPTGVENVWWNRSYTNLTVELKLDKTIDEYKAMGYTHLSFYIAIASSTSDNTNTYTQGVIPIEKFTAATSGTWVNYKVSLDTLAAALDENNEAILYTISARASTTANRTEYMYAELIAE